MIDPKKELEWLTGQLGKLYEESAERLSPEGSSPASGSRTREAGRKPDATTSHTTAPPFPDQGGGEVQRVLDSWKEEEADLRKAAKSWSDKGMPHVADDFWMRADVIQHCTIELETALGAEPLTQNGEGGNEVCPVPGCGTDRIESYGNCGSRECPFLEGTLSERERSGSGNVKGHAPLAESGRGQHGKGCDHE